MNVSSLNDLLRNFDSAITAAAGSASFSTLRQLFFGYDGERVISFVNKLIKQRDIHGRGTNTPPVANLREVLSKLEACLRSAPEAKKAADDVAKLIEFLEGCGHASVDALVHGARGWLVESNRPKPKTSPVSRTRKKPVPAALETLPLADYAALLKQTVKDNTQFDQVIERLRADRKIKTPDMRDLARLFLGYELAKKKGREAALKEIIERQAVEARQAARGYLLDRLKSW
jgi:hypothetical protein